VEERGKEGAVRRGDAWPVNLPLQDCQLVAQRQYLDVLVRVADRQQPYEGEHTRHGEVGQSQHQRPFAKTFTSQAMDGVFGIRNPSELLKREQMCRLNVMAENR
jgi:hypothetical protein